MLINSSISTIYKKTVKLLQNHSSGLFCKFVYNFTNVAMSIAFVKTFSWLSRTRSLVLPSESLDLLAVSTCVLSVFENVVDTTHPRLCPKVSTRPPPPLHQTKTFKHELTSWTLDRTIIRYDIDSTPSLNSEPYTHNTNNVGHHTMNKNRKLVSSSRNS